MTKKVLSFFYTDLHWKLISLGLAFVIWFIAMNLHDPLENQPLSRDLQIVNLEILDRYNLVLVNEAELSSKAITVGIRSYRSNLNPTATAGISAYVDMRAVDMEMARASDEAITMTLAVNANLLPGFELQYVRAATVEVEIDLLQTIPFEIEVSYIGQVDEGFELQSLRPVNPTVSVTAARGVINSIDYVRVEVDLDSVDEMVYAPIKVIGHDGEDITYRVRQLSLSQTAIMVDILPVRNAEIRVVTTGDMAPGFIVSGIQPSISTIDVVGIAEILDDIEYIEVPIEIEGLREDTTIPINIADILPEGLALSRYAPTEIILTVDVEPIQVRTFFVPRRDASFLEYGATYTTISDPPNIRVVVSGPQSIVSGMAANALDIVFDLRNLPVGIHWVPLTVRNLPPGVSLVEPAQTLHVQIYAPAQNDPEETPEPTPTPTPEPTPSPTPTPTPTPDPTPTPPPDENGNGENGNGYDDDPDDPLDNPEPEPSDDEQ
ncbi:MAG: CdaR family protein [Defluviitaleaceae bacterium]|nr:CdaR family protein [Defluviitaleaceae bacterium]